MTPEQIKSIAEQYFIESKPDWQDENQKADTTFGFRMGYTFALKSAATPSPDVEAMAEPQDAAQGQGVTVSPAMIKCPSCDTIQAAIVEHTMPWGTYVHHCEICKYIIMESEWNEIKPFVRTHNKDAAQGQEEQYHAVEFAGYWAIKTEPFYDSGKDILNAEEVGAEQAEKNAVLIAKLLNDYFTRKK